MRNLQEQVKKAFCYQKLFWPFTVRINCSSDQENFANSRPSASNFKSFSRSLEQLFLTVGHKNFGNKIPFPPGTFFISRKSAKSSIILQSLQCSMQICRPQKVGAIQNRKESVNKTELIMRIFFSIILQHGLHVRVVETKRKHLSK